MRPLSSRHRCRQTPIAASIGGSSPLNMSADPDSHKICLLPKQQDAVRYSRKMNGEESYSNE